MRALSFVALLLQLAWSTALPVIHAESEVLASQTAFEGSHTPDCPKLHDPAHSATCSAVSAAVARTVRYVLPPAEPALATATATPNVAVPAATFSRRRQARSPPLVH